MEGHVHGGKHHRTRERIRLAPATMGVREVQKIADEHLRPLNQGLETIGSATNFRSYVENTYRPVVMPVMAKSTRSRTNGVFDNYLIPAFGDLCLRDLSRLSVQRYFSEMASSPLAHESKDKIRDVIVERARFGGRFRATRQEPVEAIRMPKQRAVRGGTSRTSRLSSSQPCWRSCRNPTPRWSTSRCTRGLRISELMRAALAQRA